MWWWPQEAETKPPADFVKLLDSSSRPSAACRFEQLDVVVLADRTGTRGSGDTDTR